MKIYEVEKRIYTYWLDAYNSGYATKTRYYLNYDNAIKWAKQDLDLWEDFNGKMVPIDKEYKRGTYSIREFEAFD